MKQPTATRTQRAAAAPAQPGAARMLESSASRTISSASLPHPSRGEDGPRAVPSDWTEAPAAYPADRCVHQLVSEQAAMRPDAIALESGSRAITYRELDRQSNRLARYLKELGAGRDTMVAVFLERSIEMVVLFLGIAKAGAAYVPLEATSPKDRLAFMLQDTAARLLITQESLRRKLPDPGSTKVLAWQEVWPTLERHPAGPLNDEDSAPDDPIYVMYTSGSTGRPKGVVIPHRGVVRLVCGNNYVAITPQDRFLHLAPPAFDASTFEIWAPLLSGARCVVFPTRTVFSPKELATTLAEKNISILWLTSALFNSLIDQDPESLKPVRQLLVGGEALSVEHVRRALSLLPETQLINGYGPTESTTFACCHRIPRDLDEAAASVPIGRPISNTRVYVLGEDLRPVEVGRTGEIYIGGDGLAREYLNRPDLTARAFIKAAVDGRPEARLYRTGDLGSFRPDGLIEFLGRMDEQVKIRGHRIEPGEIEAVINRDPWVDQSVVTVLENDGEKRLAAYVVPRRHLAAEEQAGPDINGPAPRESGPAWNRIFNEIYSSGTGEPGADFSGWNSSYTGLPIPEEEMREWADATVARILELKPRKVLEIGCGTGLLLFRLAPHCEAYRAVDPSMVAIERLQQHVRAAGNLNDVQVRQGSATDWGLFPDETFDVVVFNSVAQYFPSLPYLDRVLREAASCLNPKGSIFVGDIRNFALLEAFHTSVAVGKAPPELPCTELRQQIQERLLQESELLVAPAYFSALKGSVPGLQDVTVRPKPGRGRNEMTRFRYDVVLSFAPAAPVTAEEADWRDWRSSRQQLTQVRDLLLKPGTELVALRNVPNGRVQADIVAAHMLSSLSPELRTMNDLCSAVLRSSEAAEGIEPDDLAQLAALTGFQVDITWTRSGEDGSFDAIFWRGSDRPPTPAFLGEGSPQAAPLRPEELANDPGRSRSLVSLPHRLRRRAAEALPDYMVPSAFVLLHSLPLSENGKVNRRALPQPSRAHMDLHPCVPPRNEYEELLLEIWRDVLALDEIGIQDSFFRIGGNSLQAAEMFLTIGRRFGRDLPLATLIRADTIEKLADTLLWTSDADSWSTLVEVQPRGTRAPLFYIHGGHGNIVSFPLLSKHLGEDQPFYGLQWTGLDGSRGERTVEAMATAYLAEIQRVRQHGPYLLGGHCLGGIVALEIARMLRDQGEEVALLALNDTPNLHTSAFRRNTRWEEFQRAAAGWITFLRQVKPTAEYFKRGWRGKLTVAWCQLSGARVPMAHRRYHAYITMMKAIQTHRPAPFEGRIDFFRADGPFPVPGTFSDDLLGWSPVAGDNFAVHRIASDHNDIIFHPKTVEILRQRLDEVHRRIAGR